MLAKMPENDVNDAGRALGRFVQRIFALLLLAASAAASPSLRALAPWSSTARVLCATKTMPTSVRRFAEPEEIDARTVQPGFEPRYSTYDSTPCRSASHLEGAVTHEHVRVDQTIEQQQAHSEPLLGMSQNRLIF